MANLYDFFGNVLTADQMRPTPACPQPTAILNSNTITTVAPPLLPDLAALRAAFQTWNLSGAINAGGFAADVRVPAVQMWRTPFAPPFTNFWSATAPLTTASIVGLPSAIGSSFGSGYATTSIPLTLRLASPAGFADNFQSNTIDVTVTCFWNGENAWSGITVLGSQEAWPNGPIAPGIYSNTFELPALGGWGLPGGDFWGAWINITNPANPLFTDLPARLLLIGVNIQAMPTKLTPNLWTYLPIAGVGAEAPLSFLSWGVKVLEINDLRYPQQNILSQSPFFFPGDTQLTFLPPSSPITPLGNNGIVFEYSAFDSIVQNALLSSYSLPPYAIFAPNLTAVRLLRSTLSAYTVDAGALNKRSYQRPNLIVPNDKPMPLIRLPLPTGMVNAGYLGPNLGTYVGAPSLFWGIPANVHVPAIDDYFGSSFFPQATVQLVPAVNPVYPPLYDIVPNGKYSQNQQIVLNFLPYPLIFLYQIDNTVTFYYQTYWGVAVNAPNGFRDPSLPGAMGNWVGPHIQIQMTGERNYQLYLQ